VLDVEAADLLQVRGIDRKQVELEFLSENGGATFRDISGRRGANGFVPDLPVLSACFTRTRPPVLVIGTDIGILMTRGPDFGERWSRLGHNLPRVPCSQLSALNDFAPSIRLGSKTACRRLRPRGELANPIERPDRRLTILASRQVKSS
jgi:hypothetical protein